MQAHLSIYGCYVTRMKAKIV